jgi:hypothetical protein
MSANEPLTIGMITREFLAVLENNSKMSRTISREYDDAFGVDGAKIGNTLNIRKPSRSLGRDGDEMSIEAFVETSVPLVLNHKFGDDVSFGSTELKLSIDDFSKRVLGPKVATVANKVDRLCAEQYIDIANNVGVPGTIPNTLLTYLLAGAKLDEEAVPMDDQRYIMMTPKGQVNIVDALKGLFQSSEAIAGQYRTGRMGTAVGFDWFMDQNTVTHTVGLLGGTPLVNLAGQTGSTLVTDGWTATTGAVKRGDCITADAVYAVNPQNRDSTGSLRDFVVTADTTADGSGNMTIPIYPNIIPAGAFMTTDSSPADNAPILIFGSASAYASKKSPAQLAYHRDFMTLGVADLPLPGGTDRAARVSSKKLGMSVRMVRDYVIKNDTFPCRLDLLCGAKVLYAEFAARIQS